MLRRCVAALCACLSFSSAAEVRVGITLSLTGPGASLAIPTQNVVKMFPQEVGGQKIVYTILDDASDPSNSVRNFQRLVEEYRADVVLGSSVSPATIPLTTQAAQRKVPHLSLAASARIVEPQDESRRWTFKAIQNESLMVGVTTDHMVANGVKSIAFIGFADAYGDSWLAEVTAQAARRGIRVAATERYLRTDTSVTAQVLKVMATSPDAVLIAAAGTPGALPQKTLRERGFKGPIYQTYGIANTEFLKISGKDAEGAYFAAGPVLVASQLDAGNPIRPVGEALTRRYEAVHGPGSMSIFVANAWDTQLLLMRALETALAKEAPGTEAFRAALRDALEGTRGLVTSQGVIDMTTTDHVGYDRRAAAMMQIVDGGWRYVRP